MYSPEVAQEEGTKHFPLGTAKRSKAQQRLKGLLMDLKVFSRALVLSECTKNGSVTSVCCKWLTGCESFRYRDVFGGNPATFGDDCVADLK
jgi:hypothetical protein